MNKHGSGVLASLRRIKWFAQKYASRLTEFLASPTYVRLEQSIAEMESNGSAQHGSVKQSLAATVSKKELRDKLRLQQMASISAIARAKLAGIPAPKMAEFDVPNSMATDVTLLAAGRAMLAAAAEYKQVFLDEKLPPDFLDQLGADIDALQSTIVSRDGDRLERRRATLGIVGQVHLARQLIAMAAGFMAKEFAREPHIFGEFKLAAKIGKPSVHRSASTDPPAPPGTPAGTLADSGSAPSPLPA